MPGIFSFMQELLDGSREMRLLSDTHGCTPPTGLQFKLQSSTTFPLHLHLPEVRAPSQYLNDMGFRPTLAQQLSKTYMDFVARYRNACQSHFDRLIHGGHHVTEYHREVFIILFKRTVQAWDSRFVSIIRVQLCQAGAPQATIRPERVDVSTIVISKAPRDTKSIITDARRRRSENRNYCQTWA